MSDSRVHARRWWILAVLIVSLFTVNLDNTILNVALPTLARNLNATISQLQWMIDAYVLVFAGLLMAAGALGDRFGRRRVLLAGLGIFGLGSLASAFAGSADVLIPLRALMGFGGALITPSTLSITRSVFDQDERPKAIAIWTATAGLGIVAGPVLAGLLLDHFAWGSIFLINVPVALVAVSGTIALVPETRASDAPSLDLPGVLFSVGALAGLVYGTIEAPSQGWTAPSILAAYAVAIASAVAFVVRELLANQPMLDIRIFARKELSGGVVAVLLSSLGMMGSMFFVAQYLQSVVGFSTLETGISVIPLALAMAVAAPISALFSRQIGARTTVSVGLAMVAAGLVVMAQVSQASGYLPIAVTLALVGGGMALAGTPVTTLMIAAVPPAKAGVASAINSTARELGSALGVAILGSIAAPVYAARVEPAVRMLPESAATAAQGSLTGAVAVAGYLPEPARDALASLARTAFVAGMTAAVLVGALVALAGAALAFGLLPGRDRTTARRSHVRMSEEPAAIPDGVESAAA